MVGENNGSLGECQAMLVQVLILNIDVGLMFLPTILYSLLL